MILGSESQSPKHNSGPNKPPSDTIEMIGAILLLVQMTYCEMKPRGTLKELEKDTIYRRDVFPTTISCRPVEEWPTGMPDLSAKIIDIERLLAHYQPHLNKAYQASSKSVRWELDRGLSSSWSLDSEELGLVVNGLIKTMRLNQQVGPSSLLVENILTRRARNLLLRFRAQNTTSPATT